MQEKGVWGRWHGIATKKVGDVDQDGQARARPPGRHVDCAGSTAFPNIDIPEP